MATPLKYNPNDMITALASTRGMVYQAAERLGCDADTIYNYAKRFPAVREAIQRHRGLTTDLAEQKLFESIDQGESWAVQFYLRTQAKDRGYVERHEFTGKDGERLKIHLSWDDNGVSENEDIIDPPAALAPRPAGRAPKRRAV